MKNEVGDLPATTAILSNNQIGRYISRENATILEKVFSATANGFGKVFYQPYEFTVLQDSYAFRFKDKNIDISKIHSFIVSALNKVYSKYDWGNKSGWAKVKEEKISLPTKNGEIDFDFMENFISQLEAFHLSQLEAYLLVTGLKDYTLTFAEQQALADFENGKVQWAEFNLKKLFGKSTRGKRLKSADRITGNLPFVTAGEADTGISAYIGNEVEVFSKNTTTIDMFGSAKYRNYDYGGDDHIAVVHTEKLNKHASIFTTTAIHKSSYTGKFSYARNFYAKDADELNIFLPSQNNAPNYDYMVLLISAIQKLVIKDVVLYADKKIEATKQAIGKG
ncbi:restriction endonuclease subunit S [Moraxella lincolnii]|uniref:restriction endonuclease subunit S n=1 Tax=Lwoffella lincolnii TaxID=90241 RepID=UPI0030CD5620